MKEYAHLLADDPKFAERAIRFSGRVRDVSELLMAAGPKPGGAIDGTVTYDAPCHLLHAQRIADPPLFAKVGAEGFYTAGIPSLRLGVALKVDDGNMRASEPALLAVLRKIDAVSNETVHELSKYAAPQILNTRNESVGYIRTILQL